MIQRVTSVSAGKVKKIPLLRELPKRVQEYVLDQTHVEHLNAGSPIASPGEPAGEVRYLLEGEVCISDEAGSQTLRDDSARCGIEPLNPRDPPTQQVVANTAVDLLSLPRELYEAIELSVKVISSLREMEQISVKTLWIVSSKSGYPRMVPSISIVVLLPIPIMEAINMPPFRMKISLK